MKQGNVRSVPTFPKVTVSPSGAFVDELGRELMFHGSMYIQKSFPWYPDQLLNGTYVRNLAGWGINMIRLEMMWAGAEPIEGQFNATYFDIMKAIMRLLGIFLCPFED